MSVPSILPTLQSTYIRSQHYFLPLCDSSGQAHSVKPWLLENHGLDMSLAVPAS